MFVYLFLFGVLKSHRLLCSLLIAIAIAIVLFIILYFSYPVLCAFYGQCHKVKKKQRREETKNLEKYTTNMQIMLLALIHLFWYGLTISVAFDIHDFDESYHMQLEFLGDSLSIGILCFFFSSVN